MQQDAKPSTRRIFLNQASAAAVLSSVAAASAKSQKTIKPGVSARSASRVVGANDRISVGMIGLGGMGTVHLRAFMKQTDDEKDIRIVAVGDIYTVRKERARDIAKLTDKDVHHEYRDLLARGELDAVLIAAPDHWHGQMALDSLADAAQAGGCGQPQGDPLTVTPPPPERSEPIAYMGDHIRHKQPLDGPSALDLNVAVQEVHDAAKISIKTGGAVPLPRLR
jgi:hypothetical protein